MNQNVTAPTKPKKSKLKLILLIVGCLFLVMTILGVVAFNVISAGLEPVITVENVDKINNANTADRCLDAIVNTGNGLWKNEVKTITKLLKKGDVLDPMLKSFESDIAFFTKAYGDHYNFDRKITEFLESNDKTIEETENRLSQTGEKLLALGEEIEDNVSGYAVKLNLSESDTEKLAKEFIDLGNKMINATLEKSCFVKLDCYATGSKVTQTKTPFDSERIHKIDGTWVSERYLDLIDKLYAAALSSEPRV